MSDRTAKDGPIALPDPVPPGALCSDPVAVLAETLAGSGASWWHGGDLLGAVWPARTGGPQAVPTDPNDGNATRGEAGGEAGLQCMAGVHCGFVAHDAAPDATAATLAVRWTTPPGAEARTLLTLNTGGSARKTEGENYLFLSEADGALTVQDDAGRIGATLPCPAAAAPHLAIVGLDADRLTLWLDGVETRAQGTAAVLDGAASLFIAARNQRPKLLKTLGAAIILDVWLWPGRALPSDHAESIALRRHHLWAGP